MTVNEILLKNKYENNFSNGSQNIERQESSDTSLNIWSNILQEVQNSTKKTPPSKSIILLGDNESGRSTLIARLRGVESISKGIGLEYHYLEIKDEDRDDTPKLGIWIPDGDGACTGLMKFAINESNFENVLIALVVSMSTPWTIMDSLEKWSAILRDHISKLNIPETKRKEFLERQCNIFQTYQDPDEHQNLFTKSNKKSNSISNIQNTSKQNQNELDIKLDSSDALLPLDPSILNKNLGIPIIVIATKSDYISILEKEMEYRIEHFDFIQYNIRKFCLDYGAALFYTTIKDKRTYDRLFKYLIHKQYNYPFNIPSSVVDRDSIFIPSGWDNDGKISILLENCTTIKSDSDYQEIISKPNIRKPLQRDIETVSATEDQEFLSKLQILLNKATTPNVKQEEINSTQTINNSNNTPQTLKTPHKTSVQSLKGGNPNAPDSTNLKNFFQNLLNKNAPSNSTTSSQINQSQSLQDTPLTSLNDQMQAENKPTSPTGNIGE